MSYSALSTLPFANTIMQAPYQLLPILLHTQANGLPRAYKDSSLLAKSIEDGRIVIDDLRLPWRPQIDDHLIDLILCDEPAVTESFEHRRLKVDARILALAVDPGAQLQPEASASHDRHSLRADLLAWHAAGVTETYECGVTDGRAILTQLLHGQIRVTVLPFACLGLPFIWAYCFRLADNPPPPKVLPEAGEQAFAQLMAGLSNRILPHLTQLI